MKYNQNTSGWIKAGKKAGIDLAWLHQDKAQMLAALDRLGLPRPRDYFISKTNSPYVDRLFEKDYSRYFCRLIPHDKNANRPYVFVETAAEFRDFCSAHDISKYRIQLVEEGHLQFTGGIISNEKGTCVELIRGTGEDLFHGKKLRTTAFLDQWTHSVQYRNDPEEHERKIIASALKMVGGPKHVFPGYYEFSVFSDGKILFRNYQKPDTVWSSM